MTDGGEDDGGHFLKRHVRHTVRVDYMQNARQIMCRLLCQFVGQQNPGLRSQNRGRGTVLGGMSARPSREPKSNIKPSKSLATCFTVV